MGTLHQFPASHQLVTSPAMAQILERASAPQKAVHKLPPRVLGDALASNLAAVNRLTRELRAAGIRIQSCNPADRVLVIPAEHSNRLIRNFMPRTRCAGCVQAGNLRRYSVQIDGVEICWSASL